MRTKILIKILRNGLGKYKADIDWIGPTGKLLYTNSFRNGDQMLFDSEEELRGIIEFQFEKEEKERAERKLANTWEFIDSIQSTSEV